MSLAVGTRLGPYEIDSLAGAGGMGEVYKARDVRLDRTVAVKILPPDIAADAERRRRFEQEARAASALNHPHICTVYDIGSTSPAGSAEPGIDYLVMEYVDGQTLAARLGKGPMPVDQALQCASQMADALACAHRAGIVHRDLKPGNVMLTTAGVKLLDFGLAKLKAAAATAPFAVASAVSTQGPTTTTGTLLGTVPYMAPEQLEGRETDARTDVFALGCVLYELFTGRRAFTGEGPASVISAIMSSTPPPLSAIQPLTPASLDHVVARCLAKDPEHRWQSARDVMHELQWIAEAGSEAAVPGPAAGRGRTRERVAWVLAIVSLVAAIVAVIAFRRLPQSPPSPVTRFTVTASGSGTVVNDASAGAISPDGRRLVFTVADSSGVPRLWVRRLDTLSPEPLAGTENAFLPFWSPDSAFVAFFAEGKLRKVPIGGGSPQVICDAPNGRGGSWSKDGGIVFAPVAVGSLYRVSADGGDAVEIVRPDATRGEKGLRAPFFLPDGRHFLYVSVPRRQGLVDVYLGMLDSKDRTRIRSAGSAPIFSEPGYLTFTLGDRIVAQRFDAAKLQATGDVVPLGDAPPSSSFDGTQAVSASVNGVLAHLVTALPNTELVWLDDTGHQTGKIPLPPGSYFNPSLSPDGRWAAVTRPNSATSYDLWLVDLQRSLASRLTFDGRAAGSSDIGSAAVWSPDSTRIAYMHSRGSVFDVYETPINGASPPEPLVQSNVVFKSPVAYSRDGRYLVFSQNEESTGWDLWLLPLHGDRKPVPYLRTRFNEDWADVSPDGRWLAYDSDETGTAEIYVRSFPQPGDKYRVSASGGNAAQWSRDGRKLLLWNFSWFLATVGPVLSVDVQTEPEFKAGSPRVLFTPRQDIAGGTATGDLTRFLVAVPAEGSAPRGFTVILNWQAALQR